MISDMIYFLAISLILLLLLAASLKRLSDYRADGSERRRLIAFQPSAPSGFCSDLTATLPEPARRYFEFSIAPGTPLYTVAELTMAGEFSLGSKQAPNYLTMTAKQTLAAPHGFVWQMKAKRGAMHISGSDSGGWTRFWLLGLLPVARLGGDPDHRLSAYGRYIAEAVFWTPAALLPGPGITWAAIDETTARVTFVHGSLEQSVDLTVNGDGAPVKVEFPRWSNANPEKVYCHQPFGGYLSEYREFEGFTLPTHIEAGNNFGTDDYFPFFRADVSEVRFPMP